MPLCAYICMAEHACLCVCTCVQGWFWMSSITYFFETVPLSKPGAQWLMMLAGQWMPKKCLSLSLPTTTQGLKSSTALSFSCGSWSSKLRSSCLWNKLNETSPQPSNPNFKSPSGDRVPFGWYGVSFGWWEYNESLRTTDLCHWTRVSSFWDICQRWREKTIGSSLGTWMAFRK